MSDGTTVAAGSSSTPGFALGEPSTAGYIGGAIEGYNAISAVTGDNPDREEAARRGLLAVGDVYFAGLPSLGYSLLGKNKTAKKVMDFALNPIGKYNPLVLGMEGLGIGNKTTKQYQNERWGALDPVSQSFRQANHPENDDHIWDSGKYAGQEWSWDKALDLAKEDPSQFAGVLGNFEAGGPEWAQVPADKRDNIIRRNIEEGNYYSNKGDIILHDKDRFRQIRDEELGIKPEEEEDGRGEGPAPLDNPIV